MMQTNVHWLVHGFVIIFMLAMLAVGFFSNKKIHNLADYLVAGRRLPFFLAFTTLFSTWFGAGSCLGAAGTAYSQGLVGVISDPFAAGLSLILAGLFYVHLFRRMEFLTVTEIFGKYYGRAAEIFSSFLMIPVYIGWLGSQIVAFGFVFHTLTGIDQTFCMIASTLVVLVYTYEGGMWADTITDFYQTLILVVGITVAFVLVLNDVGGLSRLIRETPGEFWNLFPHEASLGSWIAFAGQWMMMGLGCIVGQDLIQRSLASRNESIARTSAVWAGVAYIGFGMIPILLGFAGRLIFPNLENPEFIIPQLAIKYLAPIPLALFVCALLAVIMSSADSSILAASSLFVQNIYRPLVPGANDRNLLGVARMATIAVTILSLGLALWAKTVYALMVNSWTTLFICIFVPVTAALYWKKANKAAAWASMIAGLLGYAAYVGMVSGFRKDLSDPIYYQASVVGGLASFLAYLWVTFMRYSSIQSVKLASELPKQ